jgi:hypothetical protein
MTGFAVFAIKYAIAHCKATIGDCVNVSRRSLSLMYICSAYAWLRFSNRLSNVLDTIIYPNLASPQSHRQTDSIERLQCNEVPLKFRTDLFAAFLIAEVLTKIPSRTKLLHSKSIISEFRQLGSLQGVLTCMSETQLRR